MYLFVGLEKKIKIKIELKPEIQKISLTSEALFV